MRELYLLRAYTDIEMAERLQVERETVWKDRQSLMRDHEFYEVERGMWKIKRTSFISNIGLNVFESLPLYLLARKSARQLGLAQPHVATSLEKLDLCLKQPMADRLARGRALMRDPRVKVTDLEVHLGTRFTAETIERLQAIYAGVRFVWLMGADNLVQFHHWERWRDILRAVPVGVLARPGSGVAARLSVAARAFRVYQVERGEGLGLQKAPAWAFVNLPLNDASSSAIRARGEWKM